MGYAIAGETSKQAAIREIFEEIGVKLQPEELKLIKRIRWEKYNHIVDIWLAQKDVDISSTVLQPKEVSELKYITKSELIKLLNDNSGSRPSRTEEYIETITMLL